MSKFNIKVGNRIRVLSDGRTADKGSVLEITRIENDGSHEVKLISGTSRFDYLGTLYFTTHEPDGTVFRQEDWEFVEKEVQDTVPKMVVKYKHIRPQADKAKSGGMTIAYGLKHKPNGGRELHVGISYCNKGDHFNKAIGRDLALKALETKPSVFEFDLLVANLLPGYNKVKPMQLINYLFAPIEENDHE